LTKIKALPKTSKPAGPSLAVLFSLENQPLSQLSYADSAVEAAASLDQFKSFKDKTLYLPSSLKAKRVLLYGLGKASELDTEILRRAGSAAARKARDLKLKEAVFVLPSDGASKDLPEAAMAAAIAEGVWLGLYRYNDYKSKPKDPADQPQDPASFILLCSSQSQAKAASQSIADAGIVCDAVCLVRDLVNCPPSAKPPEIMAGHASKIKARGKRLSLKVLRKPKMQSLGMGGVLGVAKGSVKAPVFVHLHYKPARARKTVALVGKGVTFDSGGLSIKTGGHMLDMKCDMAGAAAVLGITLAASQLNLPVEIHAIAPFVENMPSGSSFKVDDVLTFMNGKTAEIQNTDAEGRLILADALVYASRLKPDLILDFATLTGAAIAALGMNITALMGDEKTIEKLKSAGEKCGEMMWGLPLPKSYHSHIDSKIADIKNVGNSGEAGTISAALFLKEFVEGTQPWVHCDIAGPAFLKREEGVHPAGATGTPVRTVIDFLKTF
jgi:leucyl aminopeptidase